MFRRRYYICRLNDTFYIQKAFFCPKEVIYLSIYGYKELDDAVRTYDGVTSFKNKDKK